MKILLVVLLLILLYECVKFLYEETYKNWNNKYFCKKVCDDIMLKHPFQERIFYDKFSVFVGHGSNNIYTVLLGHQVIASWAYTNDKIDNLFIYNEGIFATFKEKYILETNQDKYIHPIFTRA